MKLDDAAVMTCYFRHLQDLFRDAGIVVTDENKRQIDRAIHRIMAVRYKNCPKAWKQVKQITMKGESERRAFIDELKKALKRGQ